MSLQDLAGHFPDDRRGAGQHRDREAEQRVMEGTQEGVLRSADLTAWIRFSPQDLYIISLSNFGRKWVTVSSWPGGECFGYREPSRKPEISSKADCRFLHLCSSLEGLGASLTFWHI